MKIFKCSKMEKEEIKIGQRKKYDPNNNNTNTKHIKC